MNKHLRFNFSNAARHLSRAAFLFLVTFISCAAIFAQNAERDKKNAGNAATASAPTLTRTTTRRETKRLGYGGALTLLGAPEGSVTIESWQRPEIEIIAEIELHANTEEDLTQLARVTNFAINSDSPNNVIIATTGTHDRKFMKTVRDFPKRLLNASWKIDYRLKVPASVDLSVYAVRGAVSIAGIEGDVRVQASDGDMTLMISGGALQATLTRGTMLFRPTQRSWRGRGAELNLATGTMTVELPASFNAEIAGSVLRTGTVENSYAEAVETNLVNAANDARNVRGRLGAGGAAFIFNVGDGTLRIGKVKDEQ